MAGWCGSCRRPAWSWTRGCWVSWRGGSPGRGGWCSRRPRAAGLRCGGWTWWLGARGRGRGYVTTGTGRLARDMTSAGIAPGEGELVAWAAELSALPVSLAAEPGDSARSFGVELEFDLEPGLPDGRRAERMAGIVADLRRFGLTTQDQIEDHHAARAAGYTSAADSWLLEREPTVTGGEVVSPVLRQPRPLLGPGGQRTAWAAVALVIAIVRRHGGRGSFRTG